MPPQDEPTSTPVDSQQSPIPPQTPTPIPSESPPSPTPGVVSPPALNPQLGRGGGKKNLLLWIVTAAFILLGGGSAAYFGYYLPNKPENVLKKAILKSVTDEQETATGELSVDLKKAEAGEPNNINIKLKIQLDRTKRAFSEEIEATMAGIKLPLEVRYVGQSLYVKVGDLSTIKSLVGSLTAARTGEDSQAITALFDTAATKISNQWIEIDSTLLKQAKVDCALDTISGPFTQEDVDKLFKVYKDKKILTVKNTTKDNVNGRPATRYDVAIDMSKLDLGSTSQFNDVPFIKKLNDCTKNLPAASPEKQAASTKKLQEMLNKANVTYAVWVDKATKKINQFELKAANDDFAAVFKGQYPDEKADIKKPDGAKPLMQLVGELSALFQFPTSRR